METVSTIKSATRGHTSAFFLTHSKKPYLIAMSSDNEYNYGDDAGQSSRDRHRGAGQSSGSNAEQSLGGQDGHEEQSSKRDDRILKELKQLSFSIGNIESRVSKLESGRSHSSVPPSSKKRRAAEHRAESPMDWADRGLAEEEGHLRPEWSDSEEGEVHTISLSEYNVDLLSSSFSSTLSNSERRKVRNSFPAPDVLQTRCPRLDSVFKTSTKPEVKNADSELARIQAFVLDPVGPLARVLHGMDPEGDQISLDEARSAVKDAIRLLGNASSQISKLRRKKILKAVNSDMQDLAEEDTFADAAPNLFGSGFEAKMKERAESLKLISSSSKPPPGSKKFFRGGRTFVPQKGGGQASRGGKTTWWKKDSKSAPRK